MSSQIGGIGIFVAKPQAILREVSVPYRAPAAASADNALGRCEQALLMILLLVTLLGLSFTPVAAASPYDHLFMRHEMQSSTYELEFARLGRARAIRPEIRSYAETVINDHVRYSEALRDLARSKDVALPPTMDRRDRRRLERLSSLSDDQFDAAFLREARRINGSGIRAFRTEAGRTADPDIRAFVQEFLDVDKKHESLSVSLSETVMASRSAVIHPPHTGDPMDVVPAPGQSPMPVIHPPFGEQPAHPNRD